MKVLERKPWSYEFECVGCKSKLLAETEDVKYGTFGGGYCESGDATWYVECAVCGTTHFLYQEGSQKWKVFIPLNAKSAARAAYVKQAGGSGRFDR